MKSFVTEEPYSVLSKTSKTLSRSKSQLFSRHE